MSVELQNQIKQLSAQAEAAKQMVNEQTAISMNLRTHLNLFQQALTEANEKNSALQKEVDELKAKLPVAEIAVGEPHPAE